DLPPHRLALPLPGWSIRGWRARRRTRTIRSVRPVSAFLHAFVPLFVAVDAVGVAPVYLTLTRSLPRAERRRVLGASLGVATIVSISFALLGKAVFVFAGVTVADFQVAGGLILLAL